MTLRGVGHWLYEEFECVVLAVSIAIMWVFRLEL